MEQTPTAKEFLIEKNMATDAFVSNGIYTYRVSELMESYAQRIREEDKLPINFWTRLKEFIEDVQVNDPASEEEKEMIVHVCNDLKKQGGSEQQKCVECGRPMQKKKIIIKGDEDTCDECLCPE